MGVAEWSEVYEREVISEQRVGAMVETNGGEAMLQLFRLSASSPSSDVLQNNGKHLWLDFSTYPS
ncbi:hypothetical protein CsatA_018491 [Cannabis sativa]